MAIILRRQISDDEKNQILDRDGRVCFATGHPISEEDAVHFDHIRAFSSDGATNLSNIAPMCEKHNKQKGRLPLYDFRIKIQIDDFFKSGDALTLQDELKFMKNKNKINSYGETISITNKTETSIEVEINNKRETYPLYECVTTKWKFFYAVLPVDVVNSDDDSEEGVGLQPRYLIKEKVFNLFRHFQDHPVLQPSLCRISQNKILTFDGQHKIASLLWNDKKQFECKIYINPDLRALNATNISAHDTYSQTRFYSSIMVEKLGKQFGGDFEEYKNEEDQKPKTEADFFSYLRNKDNLSAGEANKQFRNWLYNQVLDEDNKIANFVSKSNRRTDEKPITIDMLQKSIFSLMYAHPTSDDLTSDHYKRDNEVDNIKRICNLLVDNALCNWDADSKTDPEQIKLKRVFGSKSMMAWADIFKGSVCATLDLHTDHERANALYREIDAESFKKIASIIVRLVNWQKWDSPTALAGVDSIDGRLSGKRPDIQSYFQNNGLTSGYLLGAE